jgi:hypothetical protein
MTENLAKNLGVKVESVKSPSYDSDTLKDLRRALFGHNTAQFDSVLAESTFTRLNKDQLMDWKGTCDPAISRDGETSVICVATYQIRVKERRKVGRPA